MARSRRFQSFAESAAGRALLLLVYLAVNWMSLALVERDAGVAQHHLFGAAVGIVLAICFIPLFVLARFSFGYLAGFYFYGMIAGFIWITYFSQFRYDHTLARISALESLLLFLLPVVCFTRPLRWTIRLSLLAMNRMLISALGAAVLILALNIHYGFAFAAIPDAADLRSSFQRPALLNYVTGILIYAVLPFAFAFFATQRRHALAALSIALIALFYPALLNKTVLLAVAWLPFLFFIFGMFEPRRAAVLSLLIPVGAGLILYLGFAAHTGSPGLASYLFGLVNIRMSAIPSVAMDYYSEFFSQNPPTHFCQINLVRMIGGCPYPYQIGAVFADRYQVGNLNASLFATEGIASVGATWAPLAALTCGLVLSLGNSVSARLPPQLVATSAGLVLQALLNVPLSTVLLSNGMAMLFLLWLVTPDLPVRHPIRAPPAKKHPPRRSCKAMSNRRRAAI